MILRDYQEKMVTDTRVALRNHRAVLIQSECGSGKGSVCAYIIGRAVAKGRHVLFLVRGRDRVSDMHDRVTALDLPHGVLMGGSTRENWHPIQVASIDTVYRLDHKPKADIIILDECHYGLSPTFREVLAMYPEAKIIGMSATPALGNGKPLGLRSGGIFDAIVRGPSVKDLIARGYLVGSRVFAPPAPVELKELRKKSNGEFDEQQGAAICDRADIIGDIVEHWKKYSSDRKAAVFGFNQKHAFHIAESFRASGINWAYVDAETPDGDIHTPGTRRFFWHQMDHGDLVGVSSVQTISLGWDRPVCKSVILASKTSSFPLFRQRLGRGSRPYPGYSDFTVHDHCGGLYEFPEAPFFESDVEWPLDEAPEKKRKRICADDESRIRTCNKPVPVPPDGVPEFFLGEVSKGLMLPCYRAFPPGPRQCPFCGLPLIANTRDITTAKGELTEITPEERAARVAEIRDPRKIAYLDLLRLAKLKNYKPGYPYIVFKSHYGYPPPAGWKAELELLL